MIVALKDLHQNNELSMIESENILACKYHTVLSGKKNIRFNVKEEELIFFILLKF